MAKRTCAKTDCSNPERLGGPLCEKHVAEVMRAWARRRPAAAKEWRKRQRRKAA